MKTKQVSLKSTIRTLLGGLILGSYCLATPTYAIANPAADTPAAGPYTGVPGSQNLAKVGGIYIHAADLERALASSPMATAFVSLDQDEQARIRGDMLRRLIAAQLLRLEAKDKKIDESASYQKELSAYRTSLLAQAYLGKIRDDITVPAEMDAMLRERLRGDLDALEAARSAYIGQQYPAARQQALATAQKKFRIKAWPERIVNDVADDTVLATGDGISIKVGDLKGRLDTSPTLDRNALLLQRLEESVETLTLAKAAIDSGIDVEPLVSEYGQDLATRLLLREKQAEWIPNEAAKRAWYNAHPDVGKVPNRWHIGQIVLDNEATAKAVRKRILAGESLFTLAGEMSVDPFGRERSGDMGWVRQGSGIPELENAIMHLEDGQFSEIVKTDKGFHILTILDRTNGQQKPYTAVHDRVQQAMIAEQLPKYLLELEKKYTVMLNPDEPRDEAAQ